MSLDSEEVVLRWPPKKKVLDRSVSRETIILYYICCICFVYLLYYKAILPTSQNPENFFAGRKAILLQRQGGLVLSFFLLNFVVYYWYMIWVWAFKGHQEWLADVFCNCDSFVRLPGSCRKLSYTLFGVNTGKDSSNQPGSAIRKVMK